MDGRRPAEGVTDSARRSAESAEAESALQREIEAALAVDPSPEFVAKVRARIASEPAPTSWWPLRWPVLATAAAAAVVAVAVALMWHPGMPEPITVRRGTDVILPAPTHGSGRPPFTSVRADRIPPRPVTTIARASSHSTRSVARTLSGPREPEVLISHDEQRGLELLVAAVRDGRLTPTLASQLVAGDATGEAADIPISDIVIEPLPQIAALEGAEQ